MGAPFPGPWTFKYHPWLREPSDDQSDLTVIMKGAQLGFTELVLNLSFYTIDILGGDVLYALPSMNPDAGKFSASRFAPALELSPHLQNLFTATDNIFHKRGATGNLYICGSRSRTAFKSSPCRLVVLDEVEEMTQENIPLVFERVSGQPEHKIVMLSTPSVDGMGIHKYYLNTTQEKFCFNCPSCSKWIDLEFDNLVITGDDPFDAKINDSHLICKECKVLLPHQTKYQWLKNGKWNATKSSEARGFHVSQLYSSTVKPSDIAKLYLIGKQSPSDEQEFFNSKLGLPHTVEGSRVTDQNLLDRTGGYTQLRPEEVRTKQRFITLGCDVGKFLHIEICEWFWNSSIQDASRAIPKVIAVRKIPDLTFHCLDQLMHEYNVAYAVVDLNPERRMVRQFCDRFPGRSAGCEYISGAKAREIIVNEDEKKVQVDRTSWLDLSLMRFTRPDGIFIPGDIPWEYKEQIKEQVRVYSKDKEGNPVAKWINEKADHYGHARNYCEIAFSQAVKFGGNKSIKAPF